MAEQGGAVQSYTAETIARWLLSQQSMSPKKLQKMLYYCYSWTLALLNEDAENLDNKLFNEKFEAWVHGPVIRPIYNQYRGFGFQDIPQEDGAPVIEDADVLDVLNQVVETYGHFTGNELESLTHEEDPWVEARAGKQPFESSDTVIKDQTIFKYYIQQAE